MNRISVDDIVRGDTIRAAEAPGGRCAQTLVGGHDRMLRQTVITIRDGSSLAEHESPGEATLLVLSGKVSLRTATDECVGGKGDLLGIPDERHSLHAMGDASVLLTVVVGSTGAAHV